MQGCKIEEFTIIEINIFIQIDVFAIINESATHLNESESANILIGVI